MEHGTVYIHSVGIMILPTGISEVAHQSRKSNQSHFSQARERGRTILHHLTNLFTKRGKRKLTDVGVSILNLFIFTDGCLAASLKIKGNVKP